MSCCDHDGHHGHGHGHAHRHAHAHAHEGGACAHDHVVDPGADRAFRRVLWIALVVNGAMFFAEAGSSLAAGSTALLADSLDFFADSANYAISLFALSLGLAARSRAALVKGVTMGAIGLWVIGAALFKISSGAVPDAMIMGPVGVAAFVANVFVAVILYRHRQGDANRQSAWLCSRNDAIGNLVIVAAASGIFATGSYWPDVIVAVAMAYLSVSAAVVIVRRALAELRAPRLAAHAQPGAAE